MRRRWLPLACAVLVAAPLWLLSPPLDIEADGASAHDFERSARRGHAGMTMPVGGASANGAIGLLAASAGVVHICASGCEYATLQQACDAETSTADNPLVYHVHAGLYSSAETQTCSDEANMTIRGDGPLSTRIVNTATGPGDYGGIDIGTSTNVAIRDLWVEAHRAIIALAANRGGGEVVIRNMILKSPGADLDEDCGWFNNFAAGTRLDIRNTLCFRTQDGFTIDEDEAGTLQVYSDGNRFVTAGSAEGNYGGWIFEGIPCRFVSQGDTFEFDGAGAGGAGALTMAYRFDGAASGCSSGTAVIHGATIRIANTDGNGEKGVARGLHVLSTATELARVIVSDANVNVSTTDAIDGEARGIVVENAATDVYVVGGHYRSSGGFSNRDFHGASAGARITLVGVDYETESNADGAGRNVIAGDMRRLKASTLADFSGALIKHDTTSSSVTGALFDNIDEDTAGTRGSPRFIFCDGTEAANEDCVILAVNSSGEFNIRSTASGSNPGNGTNMMDFAPGTQVNSYLNFRINRAGGRLTVGSNLNSDGNQVCFDSGTTDACQTWNDTDDRLEITGATVFRKPTRSGAPAACQIGDFYLDSSGGVCFCTAADTWTNVTPGPIGHCSSVAAPRAAPSHARPAGSPGPS